MAFTLGGGTEPMVFALVRGASGAEATALWTGAAACTLATAMIACIGDKALVFAPRRAASVPAREAVAV